MFSSNDMAAQHLAFCSPLRYDQSLFPYDPFSDGESEAGMAVFAVHLLDGFLPLSWCVAGYLGAIALAGLGCWRIHDRDIPRIALVTAAFFVASSIHIKVYPSSVHLVLNGLVGIMLGHRAGLALVVGLFLQAVLLGHGGLTTLGVNALLQGLPALAVGGIFRIAAHRTRRLGVLSICGGALSALAVLMTVAMQSAFIRGASDDASMPALLWFAVHLPVAVVEAIVVSFTVQFLGRVQPDLIGWSDRPSLNTLAKESLTESVVSSDAAR